MTWHRKLFVLLLVFLPTQLGYHFWPEWSMVLGRKIDYLSPTIYLTDILIIFLLISWYLEARPKIQVRKVFLFLVPFVLLNIWIASNKPEALYAWSKLFEFGLLGFYIIKTRPSISFVAKYLSIAVFYSSLIAIAQFLLGRSIGGPLWLLGERTFSVDSPAIARYALGGREILRAYGTFPHPNVLGGFLAVTLPIIFKGKDRRWFTLVTMGLGIVALILTFSRSALLIGIVVMILTVTNIKQRKLLVCIFLGILVLVLSAFNAGEESFVVRGALNQSALALWQQSPLFGVGLGNFLVKLPEVLPTRTIYFLQPVHNIYLLLLSEVGLIGCALLLFLFKRIIKRFSLPLIALLLLGLVDHYPLTLQQGQILFTLMITLSTILP